MMGVYLTSNARSLERLGGAMLGTEAHQTGHLVLAQVDVLAAGLGERDVSCMWRCELPCQCSCVNRR